MLTSDPYLSSRMPKATKNSQPETREMLMLYEEDTQEKTDYDNAHKPDEKRWSASAD